MPNKVFACELRGDHGDHGDPWQYTVQLQGNPKKMCARAVKVLNCATFSKTCRVDINIYHIYIYYIYIFNITTPLVTRFGGGGRQNVTVQYFFASPPPF